MKNNFLVFFILCSSFTLPFLNATSHAAKVDPSLFEFVQGKTNATEIKIIGVLELSKQEADQIEHPQRYHTQSVIHYLKKKARLAWAPVRIELKKQVDATQLNERDFRLARLNWINTSFTAIVSQSGLRALAKIDGVKKIYANRKIVSEKPLRRKKEQFPDDDTDIVLKPGSKSNVPYDFNEMNLTQLINASPSATGKNVILGTIDTGIDGNHPDLMNKVVAFFNAQEKKKSEPIDNEMHGTHTSGTMIGGSRDGNWIGVAPEAKLIGAGPIDGYDMMLASMEYMLSTEDKPLPRAINNSWNCGGAPDIELFYRALAAWEAAGILPVFSAGNAGPKDGSITPCHEYPGVLAVGATGKNGMITSFSSRGPALYKGEKILKPDLTAPGEEILSTVPNGQYNSISGTSMAAPHTTGATALLFQADPSLTPKQVRDILVATVRPTTSTDSTGWDKAYGYGKLDIFAAMKKLLSFKKEKIERMNSSPGLGLNWLKEIFTEPAQLEFDQVFADPGKISENDFEFPAALEASNQADVHWIEL